MFYGQGAGGAPTASAVMGDLVMAARNKCARRPRTARVQVRQAEDRADGRHPDALLRESCRSPTRPVCSRRSLPSSRTRGVSISAVRQEGAGEGARLVVVTHVATDRALADTVAALDKLESVTAVTSVLRLEGHRMNEPATLPRAHPVAGADRGVPRSPRRSVTDWKTVTLREGGTPLLPAAASVGDHRLRRLPQGRGPQPHRFVQGPRHDDGRHRRARHAASRRCCARPPATLRVGGRVRRRRPGSTCAVLVPAGQDRDGQARAGGHARREDHSGRRATSTTASNSPARPPPSSRRSGS